MIKNIIFDFGAVLIPIDEKLTWDAFKALGALPALEKERDSFHAFEKGELSTREFLKKLQPHFFRKKIFPSDLKQAWNALLHEPLSDDIVTFLKKLKKDYRLFLLSNTNELHIAEIKRAAGPFRYSQFIRQFDEVYYSHEVGMRKPDKKIYKKLLSDHKLKPEECFYIDDKNENVRAADKLGIHAWRLRPDEDVRDIREKIDQLK